LSIAFAHSRTVASHENDRGIAQCACYGMTFSFCVGLICGCASRVQSKVSVP